MAVQPLLDRAQEARDDDHWVGPAPSGLQIAAFLVVGTVPLIFAGIQPTLLRALVTAHRLSAPMIGRTAAVEFFSVGVGVGLAGAFFQPDRLRLRAAIAALVLFVVDLLATRQSGAGILVDRGLAGLAEGALIWQTASLIARSSTPARWTGIYSITQSAAQFAAAFIVPLVLMRRLGPDGGYLALAGAALVALVCAFALPTRLSPLYSRRGEGGGYSIAAIGSLVAVFLALASFVGFFAYFGGLAEQSHLTASQEDLTSALIVGVGIIGNAAAAILARRVSYFSAALIAIPLNLIVFAVFATLPSVGVFIVAALTFGLVWGFLPPFLVPLVIETDPSRRAATFIPGVQCLGAASGPLICSFFVSENDGRGALAVAAACLFACFVIGLGLHLHRLAASRSVAPATAV